MVVSPDRSKLAITYSGKNIVTLINSNGSVISEIYLTDANSLNAKYWLDATQVVLMDWESTITDPFPSIILDINERSWTVLASEFDDINKSPDGNGREWYPTGGLTRLSINPQQSHMVYPSYKYQETLSELVVWDLQNNVEITRLHTDLSNTFPWWSPDGTHFITGGYWKIHEQYPDLPYAGGGELVSVSLSGEISRLSYYTTKYTAIPYYYVWSPDGENIAFWMEILDYSGIFR